MVSDELQRIFLIHRLGHDQCEGKPQMQAGRSSFRFPLVWPADNENQGPGMERMIGPWLSDTRQKCRGAFKRMTPGWNLFKTSSDFGSASDGFGVGAACFGSASCSRPWDPTIGFDPVAPESESH
eukprot:CAMPEP_0196655102 /NCGR_PEP_ID=MMETSP1086-20130531/4855_1 /TAXON_ID=77921 /ORGANISM="Cyanoptyche  gloeocystis , Strain SAG4.97" /LENGTH=124 /DNA_ID=CAMNT_0041987235 /DNA_START=662 /DNA_END=1036 /DNA_ORIENTATION=-